MTATAPEVIVRPVTSARDRRDWLRVPSLVFAGDPAFVPPLLFQERRRISPRHSPFFGFGRAALFLAWKGNQVCGRISAQINDRYLERYRDNSGHFGFFDCIDDQAVADALIAAAAGWLKANGAQRMEGPYNFSTNEECGLLIEGFKSPPAMLMTHARPWMRTLLETAGFAKSMDTYAYRMKPANTPEKILRLAKLARSTNRLSVRRVRTAAFEAEVRLVIDIFNDAWAGNWGFVPFSDAEIRALVGEMKPFYREEFGRIVEYDGEPVAMLLLVPDINAMIKDFDGRLLPFNWAKLVWKLYRNQMKSARVPLMGLRQKYHNSPIAASMLALLVAEISEQCSHYDLDWIEFSWILDVNRPMNTLARLAAGDPVKTFRIFNKAIA